jgi:hypothetical protein
MRECHTHAECVRACSISARTSMLLRQHAVSTIQLKSGPVWRGLRALTPSAVGKWSKEAYQNAERGGMGGGGAICCIFRPPSRSHPRNARHRNDASMQTPRLTLFALSLRRSGRPCGLASSIWSLRRRVPGVSCKQCSCSRCGKGSEQTAEAHLEPRCTWCRGDRRHALTAKHMHTHALDREPRRVSPACSVVQWHACVHQRQQPAATSYECCQILLARLRGDRQHVQAVWIMRSIGAVMLRDPHMCVRAHPRWCTYIHTRVLCCCHSLTVCVFGARKCCAGGRDRTPKSLALACACAGEEHICTMREPTKAYIRRIDKRMP